MNYETFKNQQQQEEIITLEKRIRALEYNNNRLHKIIRENKKFGSGVI